MKIGWSTGYKEGYWGRWPWTRMYGGSERIVVEVAAALAQDHEVTVRLPHEPEMESYRGVRWIGPSADKERYDVLFCADDFQWSDDAARRCLVACRSDPPPRTDYDELIFLSRHHAELMGHPSAPYVGGGVNLKDYERGLKRTPGLVICTSSPDRCWTAFDIGANFPGFTFTYRPVQGLPLTVELERSQLVELQQKAKVHIYPLSPSRPSDFFSMSVLESLAAGTPVIVSDADSMKELWADAAIVLPLPIRLGQWVDAVDELLHNKILWNRYSVMGKRKAAQYDWSAVAARYLAIATEA